MTSDIEVWLDCDDRPARVGTLYRKPRRGSEAVSFEYHPDWLRNPDAFSLEPALRVGKGVFVPPAGSASFGSIGDSAPDTWGRRLMQRAERRQAASEGRAVHTLGETDYLLGVADLTRMGALRFRRNGGREFLAPTRSGVPRLLELGRLLSITERILRDEETDEDLRIIFAPGSSLGGARPKASVLDPHGRLSIAKFPRATDDYCLERWELIAFQLASRAGIRTPVSDLVDVGGKPVLVSRRFDRRGDSRVPFLSGLSMLGLRDGDQGSYPELVDALAQHGSQVSSDSAELYRRLTFNVLVSNVDDHLRNHGFLWDGSAGWRLSPAYDLNPTPVDVRPRILTTRIDLDDGTCDLELVRSVHDLFGLGPKEARDIIREVATAVATWQDVARSAGAPPAEIRRMASAFEHADLQRAQSL